MKKQTFLALGAGWLNGLFGIGGGLLALPMLTTVLEDEKEAQRAVSCFLFPLSCLSAASVSDAIPSGTLWLCAGAVLGGYAGTLLAGKMHVKLLKILFALCLLWSGVRALW